MKKKSASGDCPRPPSLGITGGIACGKSTVTRMLGELGAATINADDIGREIVAPGRPALAELVRSFGAECLQPDGALNRRGLGRRVFGSPAALATLNRITHFRIERELDRRIRAERERALPPPVIAVEAAVLVEAGWFRGVDFVVVVTAQQTTQVARLIHGSNLTREEAEARVNSQVNPAVRLERADFVINGDSSRAEVERQVKRLWDEVTNQDRGGGELLCSARSPENRGGDLTSGPKDRAGSGVSRLAPIAINSPCAARPLTQLRQPRFRRGLEVLP